MPFWKAPRWDILLTDIEMPDGTGHRVDRWQKEHFPGIVSIFYTCHADFSYAQEAVKLGALDYLLKPVPIPELESILGKAVEGVKRRREGERLAEIFKPQDGDGASVIGTVKQYIADNLSMKIQREELAKMVYLNPDYLSKLFHKQVGMTLGEYILEKRLALAKQLLINTDLSIADISQRVGITDASYFIRTFKRILASHRSSTGKTAPSPRGDLQGLGLEAYSRTRNRMVWLPSFRAVSSPWCLSAIPLAMERPMPNPLP